MGHVLPVGRLVRGALAALLALAAGAAMWARAEPIEPHLQVAASRAASTEGYDLWNVSVLARGGERIGAVRLEVVSGTVQFGSSPVFIGLPPGAEHRFLLVLPRTPEDPEPRGLVRVVQDGRAVRTYDVQLGGDAP